ncbi:hypothetical protein TWF106_003243 [Orbilia oligospora]|uniref:Uncharacterized protein n=1 Tax=Orbilia oligospora TaxID=2813651 RepID=A0A7C8V0H4_ORBOL|nr:hypothetical protein TWF106_003243 [Orbilia oligospora]
MGVDDHTLVVGSPKAEDETYAGDCHRKDGAQGYHVPFFLSSLLADVKHVMVRSHLRSLGSFDSLGFYI